MKTVFALAMLAVAAPAIAQTNAVPAPAPAPAAKFSLDTPIEAIAADKAGKAVLDQDLPGLTSHAMYDSFKSMTLKALAPMSGGALSDAALAKVQTDLAAIK